MNFGSLSLALLTQFIYFFTQSCEFNEIGTVKILDSQSHKSPHNDETLGTMLCIL